MRITDRTVCDATRLCRDGIERICNRTAKYERYSAHGPLHFCQAHKDRAYNPKPEHYVPSTFSEVRSL